MKRTKQDKQFMIKFDESNRNFLMNLSMFLTSVFISILALLISVLSLIYNISGPGLYLLCAAILFVVLLFLFYFKSIRPSKMGMKNTKKLNEQLEKELFEIYPEYKNKLH